MKKLFILLFLTLSLVSFAQETNDSAFVPKKFASWTISENFDGKSGIPWGPSFNVAIDKEGYYCVVNLINPKKYFYIHYKTLPHLYFKTENGDIIDLEMDKDEPVHKFYISGYSLAGYWIPGRYVTRLIYKIPNIDEFLSHNYIKYRIWIGESFMDVELSERNSKKINKKFRNGVDEVTSKYKEKIHSLNNPLDGF